MDGQSYVKIKDKRQNVIQHWDTKNRPEISKKETREPK